MKLLYFGLWLNVVTLPVLLSQNANSCPENCNCIPGTVRCINVGLKEVPRNIPANTYVL